MTVQSTMARQKFWIRYFILKVYSYRLQRNLHREPVAVGQSGCRRTWKGRGRRKDGGAEGKVGGCKDFGEDID